MLSAHSRWPVATTFLAAALVVIFVGAFGPTAQSAPPDAADELPQPIHMDGKLGNAGDGKHVPKLLTIDGVELAVSYYPSNKGKEAVPVVLLHMTGRNRQDFVSLAVRLQAEGHAVLIPDLRGHGDSTRRRGQSAALTSDNLTRIAYQKMVRCDMLRLKQFLLKENNDGKLNIEKLTLVGAELGAAVALSWTYLDWIIPTEGNKKMGQDVKALVLVSPNWTTPGLSPQMAVSSRPLVTPVWDPQLRNVFRNPGDINFRMPVELDFRRETSLLIFVGKNATRAQRDAKRLYTMFERFHPAVRADRKGNQADLPFKISKRERLFLVEVKTSLQGTKMLSVENLGLETLIADFINKQVAVHPYSWAVRKRPYD